MNAISWFVKARRCFRSRMFRERSLLKKMIRIIQTCTMQSIIFRQMNTEWTYNFANAGIGTTLCFALPTQEFLASFFHKNASAVQQKVDDFLESVSNMP